MPSAFGKPVTTANRFGVAATTSAWTLVTTLTASASASLSYTSFASTSYKNYALLFSGFLAATAGDLYVYFSVDGGATYPTGGTDLYLIYTNSATTVAATSAQNYNFAYAFQNLNSASQTSMGGILYFTYGVVASARSELSGTLGGNVSGTRQGISIIAASYNGSSSEVNAIKFQMVSGNITNGTIKIYGIT